MRRVIGLILTGLGTFLIVCAVLLPTWVSSQVIKFPLNEFETATLAASNASYFSPSSLTEKTGVSLEATYTIKGDGAAGNSSTAVWDEYSYAYDLTNRQAVQQMTRRFAFDRRTALLVMCCGANVNGDSSIEQRGYLGYVFPIGTQKQTYDVFDTTLNKPDAVRVLGDDGRAWHRCLRVRGERRSGAGRHPDATRLARRAERGLGHSARVLPDTPDLLRGPGHRGADRRQRAPDHIPAQPRHRRPGPAALRRRPGRHACHRARTSSSSTPAGGTSSTCSRPSCPWCSG